MKCSKILLLVCCLSTYAMAQPPKKSATKEKAPTQAEMQQMMKDAQKEMEELDPETKKMMDSMGIKMPDMKQSIKNAGGISNKQLADAWEDENRIVPRRDAVKIAAIPKDLSDSRMADYISATYSRTATLLTSEINNMGNKVYSYIMSISRNNSEAGNMAVGLWIAGKPALALYITGKICIDNASITDNLSNYASMLSMLGAQHLAIPILNNLNLKFPNNSTLLNNLGQAWFGLGDMPKAEKYLDSAIRIYAYHPQANFTRSFIEEEKGNKSAAVTLVKKSMLHSYSQEKEERLRKLGHELTSKEVKLPKNKKADPLNLGGSVPPPFPMSVDECIGLEPIWDAYKAQLKEQSATLAMQYADAEKNAMDLQQKRTDENMRIVKTSLNTGTPQGLLTLMPLHAGAATIKYKAVTDEYNRKTEALEQKVKVFMMTVVKPKKEFEAQMAELQEKDLEQTGEGLPNEDFCPKYKAVCDKYLRAYNSGAEPLFKEYLEIEKKYLNESLQCQLYSEWPEKFEADKLLAKISWLDALSGESSIFFQSITRFKCAPPAEGKGGKLANFDDVACPYNDTMNLKIITFTSNCSRMTSTFDFTFLKYVRKDDFERAEGDTYISSTYKLSAEAGKDLKAGPLKVEAKVGGGIEFEFGRKGLEDVVLIGEAKVGAGTGILDEDEESGSAGIGIVGKDAFPTTVEVGVEGRISILSGRGSVSGTGLLEGLKK